MKALVQIVAGLIVLVVGIFLLTYQSWLKAFITLIQGGIIGLLLLIGIALLLLGLSELKD